MFVLFLRFAVLRISVSLATENNVHLKDQLQRSLSHVNHMLADIEGKIDSERKILSQIDDDLNYNNDTGFLDYSVTDIWWHTSKMPGTKQETSLKTGTWSEPDETTVVETVETSTTPTIFVKDTTTTVPTPPAGWPFSTGSTEPDSLFIQDLKTTMALNKLGYGSAFLSKLLEIIARKDTVTSFALTKPLASNIIKRFQDGKFGALGQNIATQMTNAVPMYMFTFSEMDMVRYQAGKGHFLIKNKETTLDKQTKELLDFYDSLFKKEEGEELFASIEVFDQYPEGGKSPDEICERMVNAYVAPYYRVDGTREQKKLVRLLYQVIQNYFTNWRARTMESGENYRDTNDAAARIGFGTMGRPERRSMNYKKIVQHLLHKHPRILKKLNQHHKEKVLRKKNVHHDLRDYDDPDEARLKKYGHLYSSHRFKQRALTDSSKEPDRYSEISEAFYHDRHINHVSSQRKKVLHQIKRRNKMKRRKHRRERRKQHRKRKLRERQHATTLTTTATAPPTTAATTTTAAAPAAASAKPIIPDVNPEYLKQLAISFFRKKQATQNYRRLNIPSSDEEIYNTAGYSSNSTEHLFQKLREDTSYSDEEDHLKNNLYDALRHNNKTFVRFRTIDSEENVNETVRDVSSETDDEWVLKNNIYKVFEKKNQLYRK